jgi:hypothetical protein
VEVIANSMEPPYKKKKEYVPFISQRMYGPIFSLSSSTHSTNVELQSFCHATQSLTHCVGPFTNMKAIFIVGVQLDSRTKLPLDQQLSIE